MSHNGFGANQELEAGTRNYLTKGMYSKGELFLAGRKFMNLFLS